MLSIEFPVVPHETFLQGTSRRGLLPGHGDEPSGLAIAHGSLTAGIAYVLWQPFSGLSKHLLKTEQISVPFDVKEREGDT